VICAHCGQHDVRFDPMQASTGEWFVWTDKGRAEVSHCAEEDATRPLPPLEPFISEPDPDLLAFKLRWLCSL